MSDSLPEGIEKLYTEFFFTEESRLPDQNCYPDIFNDPVLFPLQRQRETARMMEIARRYNPRTIYEIGTDKGGGLYHWCKGFSGVFRIIACEIRGTPFLHQFEKAFPSIDFLWLAQSSYDPQTVEYVKAWLLGETIDILFIDGDKSKFLEDFYAYLPLMSKHSVVFMHDVRDEGPNQAWNHITNAGFRHTHILDISESEEAVVREIQGVPPASAYENWLRHWKGASASVGVIYLDR